ncbi:MAG: pantoate--beta-alanine ligase [Thermodesulfobacteriota bacterium]|nr:pantoate--beta-alanine ligase [Thermodesulfobacteriota bacterium]
MKIIESVKEMQEFSESLRNSGKKIAFVPTMGYFHHGHLSLMEEGRKLGDCLIISIYVNPTQFGPGEDLEKYPRDFESDGKLSEDVGVDVIFYPPDSEMYPEHYQTFVDVERVTNNLCGLSRPGHFRGVTTICAKLFNIVKPHVTVFGKKDFQQLVTIKRMVTDLNMDMDVVGMPTIREADGLAMSSRNTYLKEEERESALSLSRSLKLAKELYDNGERNAGKIIDETKKFIEGHPHTKIDYVNICDTTTMNDVEYLESEAVIALAVRVGAARLIDNYVFGEPLNIK